MIGIFFREIDGKEIFYPIEDNLKQDWAAHAACNPGTLRIEDVHGNILWEPSANQEQPQ